MATAAKKRRRRGRKHPGVVLLKPSSEKRMGWRARWLDPDSEDTDKPRWIYRALPAELTTAEQREDWAVSKSQEIADRRFELARGAPRATGLLLSDAIRSYFEAHPRLRPRTLEGYEGAAAKLTAFAERERLRSVDELDRGALTRLPEALIKEPKRTPKKHSKRGTREATTQLRSPERVNSELRKLRTILGYLSDADRLPKLTRDDLRRALKRLPVTHERLEYLKPAECAELLRAALEHDAETFAETRDEHRGLRPLGTTTRYEPIAPLVTFCLFTGCRFGEALALEWDAIDLGALDHDGRPVGEIHLRGADTKTHKARTIGLEVSPALRSTLEAMRPKEPRGSVFGLTRGTANAAAKRLRREYRAPRTFTWQALRRSCGTYLTCAGGIFGAASAYRSAKQLGHSVVVAERSYVGLVRGISSDARTLEAAMQVEQLAGEVIERAKERRKLAELGQQAAQ